MTKKEKSDVGKRVLDFLEEEEYSVADAARELSPRLGISFEAAQERIHRLVHGRIERKEDVFIYLYEKFRANMGFLLTGQSHKKVKPWQE